MLLNLAVIPLMGILLPCLMGLQLVARLTALAHCLELPQHLLCTAIEAIFSCYEQLCRFTTALPGSILHTGYPTWQALAVYTIGLIALAVSGKKLRPHLRLAAAVCLMGIFLIRLPGELNVTMLDVGQGECVGIETREHHVYLVDAGSTSKKKTGQYQIIPWLKYIGDAERGRYFHHALGRRPHQRGRGAVGVVEKQPGQNPAHFSAGCGVEG